MSNHQALGMIIREMSMYFFQKLKANSKYKSVVMTNDYWVKAIWTDARLCFVS